MSGTNAWADGSSGKPPAFTLLLYLAGPMQSWGSRSRFDDRDTHLEPTRSGILGMLCCALGIGREDTASLSRLNDGIRRIGMRVDAPGRVARDYHTAQRVINAAGKGESTVVSTRHYLADARFLVALESNDHAHLTEIREGLRSPRWSLFLGRKSFPLSLPPLLPGEWGEMRDGDAETALHTAPWYSLKWRMDGKEIKPAERPTEKLRLVLEWTLDDKEYPNVQSDMPLDFDRRRFAPRRFRNDYLLDIPKLEVHPCLIP